MASPKNKQTQITAHIRKLFSCLFLGSKKQATVTREQRKRSGMKVDLSTDSSGLVNLPTDLLHQVACFLVRDDLVSLALTSPTIYQHLSIGSVNHPADQQGPNHNNDPGVVFNDRFGCGWGYAAKLQSVATFANRPIHSVQVSFRWRDQGWGNQKGMARIVAVNADNTSHCQVSCTHSAGIAPHEETEQKSMCFMPLAGMEYFLQVRVGGGGGHSLHLKNIQQHYIIFDDEDRSVTRTHQQLMGGGTTVPSGAPSLLRCARLLGGCASVPSNFPLLLRQCQVVLAELQGKTHNNYEMESQENATELYAILKRIGHEKTPASVKLLQDVLLAESKYQEQVQATTWTMGIGSSELMPIIANHRHFGGLRIGDGWDWNNDDDLDEDEFVRWEEALQRLQD
ncbi:expressed unknown protein [Seminavis robusta]|uniref:F-box domain-containing protein n=1 Tax=Seminavis robusta TaxID=568900 RepID=A0A9N8DP72_9STRA|nr:expressed unknown protein [Seminavis robusta]|eukprot:Sro241_g096230.1 n/a (397) ;mRNA; r:4379-5569